MAFKKGDEKPKNSGRKKGSLNKENKLLREMIVGALDLLGGEAWLVKQAKKHPTAFFQLIAKVIPLQLAGVPGEPIEIKNHDFSLEEIEKYMKEKGIPIPE